MLASSRQFGRNLSTTVLFFLDLYNILFSFIKTFLHLVKGIYVTNFIVTIATLYSYHVIRSNGYAYYF